ncbi:MAG: prepilin peptidase [Brevundimonas sp.]|jgi:prepilin peptidase CpaA|uniref:A24 family peptidase n=1 Tax=Brevundimonas sp. TaxID=1871086 RepID=UPI0017C3D403|nr:prepilin peptidase [Brevundimonas sp.]MBA4803555.1 prepilin peptidase [Brevundimonas sp.]
MDLLTLALLGVMPALAIVGGLHDLTTMKIPNWISGLLVLLFFPAALAAGLPLEQIGLHLGVGVLALLIGAGMFALRWIGGGDAKLMAAACLWLGVSGSGMFLLWTGLAGGLFCLILIFSRAHLRPYALQAPAWVGQLMEPKGDIPYGVAIAAGALLAWPESPLMLRFVGG